MATWIACLVCKSTGEKDPEFLVWRTDGVPECPKCGNLDVKRMEPFEPLYSHIHLDSRNRGSDDNQTEAEDYIDHMNKLDIEQNKDKVDSGEWKLKIPKSRPRRFDPDFLSERHVF